MARLESDQDQLSDARVGYTLLGGLWLSVLVMVAGFVLVALAGLQESSRVVPLQHVISRLAEGKPGSVLSLGILLLFATPFAGVLVALFEFVRRRDMPFVWVCVALIAILIVGFAIALR
jgi:uncharacterized membrane protein